MTREEYEQLQRKFGTDISVWPAPYRAEALILVLNEKEAALLNGDEGLDRAVLEAALMPTDDMQLARDVLKRIDENRAPNLTLQKLFPARRAAFASFAAVLMVAAVSGYVTAKPRDDLNEDEMLSLAMGSHADISELLGVVVDDAEEGL